MVVLPWKLFLLRVSSIWTQLDMDETNPIRKNLGWRYRAALTNASNVVELLHSDIFFQEKLMLNGVDIKIRMTRSKDEFCLMRHDALAYKVNILSASLCQKSVYHQL